MKTNGVGFLSMKYVYIFLTLYGWSGEFFYTISASRKVEDMSSVSPACRKRRLKGRRYIAIVADTA